MAFVVFVLGLIHGAFAADATGILKVKSSITTAQVWLDGVEVGAVPFLKYVPVGPHKLRVVADNYDPFVRNVTIEADKTVEFNVDLTPGPGSVEFTGPQGASLSFGGKTYALPVRVASPGKGTYPWTVTAPGFEDGAGSIDVAAGRNYLVDVKLESSAGLVAVESTPAGAKVTVDGKDVGVTPVKVRGLPEGVHGVLVELDGYATVAEKVDTTGGKRGSVAATLDGRSGVELLVDTGAADAKVYVDEALVGTGESVHVVRFASGRADVRVVSSAGTADGAFRFPSSGKLELRVAGAEVVQRKPLTQRWGFWAAVGGGAVALGGGAAAVAVATSPAPPATGDTVVTLP